MMAAYSHTCRTPRGLVTATTPRAQDTDGGGLGVAAIAEAVAEAGAERDDVLHRAAQLGARDVSHSLHRKVLGVEELAPLEAVLCIRAPNRRLGKVALGDLVGDVGAH